MDTYPVARDGKGTEKNTLASSPTSTCPDPSGKVVSAGTNGEIVQWQAFFFDPTTNLVSPTRRASGAPSNSTASEPGNPGPTTRKNNSLVGLINERRNRNEEKIQKSLRSRNPSERTLRRVGHEAPRGDGRIGGIDVFEMDYQVRWAFPLVFNAEQRNGDIYGPFILFPPLVGCRSRKRTTVPPPPLSLQCLPLWCGKGCGEEALMLLPGLRFDLTVVAYQLLRTCMRCRYDGTASFESAVENGLAASLSLLSLHPAESPHRLSPGFSLLSTNLTRCNLATKTTLGREDEGEVSLAGSGPSSRAADRDGFSASPSRVDMFGVSGHSDGFESSGTVRGSLERSGTEDAKRGSKKDYNDEGSDSGGSGAFGGMGIRFEARAETGLSFEVDMGGSRRSGREKFDSEHEIMKGEGGADGGGQQSTRRERGRGTAG